MEQYVLPESFKVPKLKMQEQPDVSAPDGVKAKTVPTPTGWRILCIVPDVQETFGNTNILKAEEQRRTEELTSHVLFVLKVGPDAYKDPGKFPSGPWCKEGDFVLTRAYAGTRFKIFGREFRVIADDQVDGVIEDPRGVTSVYQ